MQENVNKMVSFANFFEMRAFTYNENKFVKAYITYLYVKLWKWSFQQEQNHCVKGAMLIWRKISLMKSTSWLQPLACLLFLINFCTAPILFL